MSLQKDLFVFIGPPGSGKGTISSLCTQQLKWVQLSTGNLCRKHIAEQTDIGKEIALAISSGKLISDNLIIAMVEEWLEQVGDVQAVILDGYPRAVSQAEALHNALKERFKGFTLKVVKFDIPDEHVVTRLTSRLVCKNSACQATYSLGATYLQPKEAMKCDKCSGLLGQRKDDDLAAVRERIAIYHKHTDDLLQFYNRIGQPILQLKAKDSVDRVFEDFRKLIGLDAL